MYRRDVPTYSTGEELYTLRHTGWDAWMGGGEIIQLCFHSGGSLYPVPMLSGDPNMKLPCLN